MICGLLSPTFNMLAQYCNTLGHEQLTSSQFLYASNLSTFTLPLPHDIAKKQFVSIKSEYVSNHALQLFSWDSGGISTHNCSPVCMSREICLSSFRECQRLVAEINTYQHLMVSHYFFHQLLQWFISTIGNKCCKCSWFQSCIKESPNCSKRVRK